MKKLFSLVILILFSSLAFGVYGVEEDELVIGTTPFYSNLIYDNHDIPILKDDTLFYSGVDYDFEEQVFIGQEALIGLTGESNDEYETDVYVTVDEDAGLHYRWIADVVIPLNESEELEIEFMGNDLSIIEAMGDDSLTIRYEGEIYTVHDENALEQFGYGYDDDEAEWVWDIESDYYNNTLTHIGVKYNQDRDELEGDLDEDWELPALSLGDVINFPNDYLQIQFKRINNYEHESVTVEIDDYVNFRNEEGEEIFDGDIAIVFESGEDNFIWETDEYEMILIAKDMHAVGLEDINGNSLNSSYDPLGLRIKVDDDYKQVYFGDNGTSITNVTFQNIGDATAPNGEYAGDLVWNIDWIEDNGVEWGDLILSGEEIGRDDEDVMTDYGVIIEDPENNLDYDYGRLELDFPIEAITWDLEISETSIDEGLSCGDTIYESTTLIEDLLNCDGECEQKDCWDFDSSDEECFSANGCNWDYEWEDCYGDYYTENECGYTNSNECNEQSDCEWEFDGHGLLIEDLNDIILDCDGYSVVGDEAIGVYDSENITIKNCNISNARTAIEVDDSENIQLLDNNLQYMDGNILEISFSNNVFISGNNLNYADDKAIEFSKVTNSEISYNLVNGNGDDGIGLEEDSNYNSIFNNIVSYNENHGIQLFDSKFNIISGNSVENNFDDGVALESYSDYNSVFNNLITNNNESGIIFTFSSNNFISNNLLDDNAEHGIYVHANSSENTIWNNQFIDNEEDNAREEYDSYNNNWNLSDVGNYWSDFEDNSGYQNQTYYIPGDGGGVDYHPVEGVFSITIISPDNAIEVGPDVFLINISVSGDVDTIWYNTTNGIEYYESPVYVNVSDIPWSWEWYGWPIYDDVKTYKLNVWANNTFGFIDYEYVEFYADVTRPNVTIISPEHGEVFDIPEVLINLSAWDNFGVDRVKYSIQQYMGGSDYYEPYEWIIVNETYAVPVNVTLPDGGLYGYSLYVSVNDTSGNTNSAYITFNIDAVLDCGDTITEDTTLTEDLLNCSGNGLIIGANDITLDCDSHSIEGDYDSYGMGIYINQFNGTTIQNCNISGFENGTSLDISSYNTLNNNIFTNNYEGINLGYSSSFNNIYNNTLNDNNNTGIYLYDYNYNNSIFGNIVENNGDYGIYLDWHNDNNSIFGNIVENNGDYGIYLNYYNDYNTIWNNQFIDNGENNSANAYQYYYSHNNNWNLSDVGNYWSDFEDNSGHPYVYNIPGDGNDVDYHPIGAFSITIISPDNATEVGPDMFLINISVSGDIDKIWYNTTNGIEYYEGPVYVNVSDIPWSWEWYGWPIYGDVKTYKLNVWANNTFGFIGYKYVEFYADVTRPNVTIISPEHGEVFDTPEVLINLSAWDNFGVDRVWYGIQQQYWPYEFVFENETYIGPVDVTLPNGNYSLYVNMSDNSGLSDSASVFFTVNATEPVVTIHSPANGTEFNEVSQILLNFSADSDFGIDTIFYNYNNMNITYTGSIYVDVDGLDYGWNWYPGFGSDYGYHMQVCANDTAGNEECGLTRFDINNNPPNITIQSPYGSEWYTHYYNVSDQSSIEILLNISAWDNLGTDTVWYDINDESAVIYEEPIFLEFEIGNYSLTACVNDSLGQIVCDVANFMVEDYNDPEILIHSPLDGLTYETAQILVNLSASDNVEVDTIWYNHSGNTVYYEDPVYEDFNLGYNYFYACVNDTSGNTNCENIYFNVSMPDLIVTNISSFLSDAGNETTVEVTFKNIGLEESDYYYAYNFNYGGRNLIRDSFSGRGLEPGEETTILVSYVYDFAGDYTFYFELDPNNLIDEFNETNNIGLESYFINGTPDLTPALLSFEQSFENPNLVTFNIEVSALGGTIWVDDFTYHINYGDGEGEGGSISETIMPWESYNFSLTHEYSTFGDYKVFFEVDPENSIFEFDESNNFFETTITLEEETVDILIKKIKQLNISSIN